MFSPSSRRRSRGASVAIKAAAAGIVVGLGLTAGSAFASVTITGTITAVPANTSSTPINIASGSAAWAYFGYKGATTDLNTDTPNAASFTALTSPQNSLSPWTSGPGRFITFGSSASYNFVFVNGPFGTGGAGQSGNSLSFTSKLLAPSETLNVYALAYNSKANFDVTVANGTTTVGTFTDAVALPTTDGDGSGAGHGYGLLTLDISGASAGDLVTVASITDMTGVTSTGNGNVGFQAADVVVPEPASMGLLGLGGLGLLMLKRRRTV